MHSHERTLISSLGFNDPDKKSGEHDLACQYLADPATIEKLSRILLNEGQIEGLVTKAVNEINSPPSHYVRNCYRCGFKNDMRILSTEATRWTHERPMTEVPLVKGKDQYRTVVGFVDFACEFNLHVEAQAERHEVEPGHTGCGVTLGPLDLGVSTAMVVVEVKINQVGVGDIIRQMKLYRQFYGFYSKHVGDIRPKAEFLASRYPMCSRDVDTLASEGIRHIHLGQGFTDWMKHRNENPGMSESTINL